MLGTMNFGELTDEPTAFGIMDAALEAGVARSVRLASHHMSSIRA